MYKFCHIRPAKYNNRCGAITIASNLEVNPVTKIPHTLEFAVAFCSPKDNFEKKWGRKIASARVKYQDSNYYRKIPLLGNRKLTHYDISSLIFSTVFGTMKVPHWALESF